MAKPAPPDDVVHFLPLSHSRSPHTKPFGGCTIAKSFFSNIYACLFPKQRLCVNPRCSDMKSLLFLWTLFLLSKERDGNHLNWKPGAFHRLSVTALSADAHSNRYALVAS